MTAPLKSGLAKIGMAGAPDRSAYLPAVPSDMRLGNLLRMIDELRQADTLSRSDLARSTALGVPTVHRLVLDLQALGLVAEVLADQDHRQKGRPAALYRLEDRGVLVAGVDVGNETTRWAVASLTGRILAARTRRTRQIGRNLVEGVTTEIQSLLSGLGSDGDRLAGVGIGVSAVVDPATGVLRDPPQHANWQGLELGELVRDRLGCDVSVRQDDHFAAVAEASSIGTFPGARSIVVLEIGSGIGAAMMMDGVTMIGAHGRFGRIANWPVSIPRRGVARSTLGASLVAGGLVDDYRRRGGTNRVFDGYSLFQAAREGDVVADEVLAWAGREIAELVIRLSRLFDPTGVVLGGGLARGFAQLERHLLPHLPAGIVLAPSVLGENAVVIGGIITSRPYADAWVAHRLRSHVSDGRAPGRARFPYRRS